MLHFEDGLQSQQVYIMVESAGWIHGETASIIDNHIDQILKRLRRMQGIIQEKATINVSILEYNTICGLPLGNAPQPVASTNWKGVSPGGLSDIGTALKTLEAMLSEVDTTNLYSFPLFIFIIGGDPTDNYHPILDNLNTNPLFQNGLKLAFGIPSLLGYNRDLLVELTRSSESVFDFAQLESFVPLVRSYLRDK